jgi:hypothetical protein
MLISVFRTEIVAIGEIRVFLFKKEKNPQKLIGLHPAFRRDT